MDMVYRIYKIQKRLNGAHIFPHPVNHVNHV